MKFLYATACGALKRIQFVSNSGPISVTPRLTQSNLQFNASYPIHKQIFLSFAIFFLSIHISFIFVVALVWVSWPEPLCRTHRWSIIFWMKKCIAFKKENGKIEWIEIHFGTNYCNCLAMNETICLTFFFCNTVGNRSTLCNANKLDQYKCSSSLATESNQWRNLEGNEGALCSIVQRWTSNASTT